MSALTRAPKKPVGRIGLFEAGGFTPAEIADYQNRTAALNVDAKINVALSVAAALGARLVVPAGRVNMRCGNTWNSEGGLSQGAFPMTSNMHVLFEAGAEWRFADGLSTDAAPARLAMFYTNQVLHDVSFYFEDGAILDGNGANNKISPNRAGGVYNRYDQAMIMVSGTPGGTAARIDRCAIIGRGRFINNAGSCCIVMAQSNVAGVTLGENWTVDGPIFENNGLDTDDHTSIFGWANKVAVRRCVFTADTMAGTVGSTGGTVAFEFHGSDQVFSGNTVKNYYRGVWYASNLTADCQNQAAYDNELTVKAYGFDVFRTTAALGSIRGAQCYRNRIHFDDSNAGPTPGLKVGVNIACDYAVSDFEISDLTVTKSGNVVACAGVCIAPGTVAGQTYDNIRVEGVKASGVTYGALVKTNATNGLGLVSIKNCSAVDLTTATAGPTNPVGVAIGYTGSASAIATLILDGNDCVDRRATPQCQYGTNVSGIITDLFLGQLPCKGMTVADYFENGATITNRRGVHDRVTFTPAWSIGAAITLGNGSVQGVYSIQGKRVMLNAKLVMGSTTNVGAGGGISLALPVASGLSGIQYEGHWRIARGGTFYTGMSEIDGTGTALVLQINGGGNANQVTPVALTAGDVISVQIIYYVP